uniref:Dynein regulatory complex protein 10 n=1 Tax=Lygus hesperus TaxID=30085 RepID=A0A0A9W5A7_LYGHE
MIKKLPEHNKDLIETLKNVFKHFLVEISISPKEAEEQEIELSRKFMAFESLSNEMAFLHSHLRPVIEANMLRIVTVCKEVQSLKDQKKKLREFLVHSHQRIRNNLEKNTMMYNLEAMKTTKEKMGPRKELITKHQNLVKEDLVEEKSLRVKKYKIEQVLQGIINKYEEDMADRNKKLAHLNEMYDKEMAQMKQMQERFDAQEKVYELLMAEKAKYEQSVWEAKLREIQKKIAARKIQRFYRGYLAFMHAHGRKKGKGKGKGKKRS